MAAAETRITSTITPEPAVPGLRMLASLMLIVALLLGSAETALAEGDQGEGGPQEGSSEPADAPPGDNPEAEAERKAYLTLLFQAINIGRDRAPTPRYEYMTDSGSEAMDAYLQDLLPAMKEADACFHGSENPDMQAGWDYLGEVGIDESSVGGEVLACPDVDRVGFWTPPGISTGWWNSPSHWKTLYGDVHVKVLACGVEAPINGGESYETVACTTLTSAP
jgi:hypothetical protein